MKEKIKNLWSLNKKYDLSLTASSLSFYLLISSGTLSLILIVVFNYFNVFLDNFLITDIFKIISNTLMGLVNENNRLIIESGFNIVLILSILYTASSVLHRLNHFTDKVYEEYPFRSYLKIRISSILMFLMLLSVVIFEIMIIFYGDYFIINIILLKNNFMIRLVITISEIIMFYITILLLYTYLPPIKMKYKEVKKESFLVSLSIYVFLEFFKIIFKLFYSLNKWQGVSFGLVALAFLINVINYVICLGIIKIYQNKKINNGYNNIGGKQNA